MTPGVIVRPAHLEDMAGLAALGARPAGTHRRRLSLQRAGAIVYLVAHIDERIAGHLVLSWSGASEWAIRSTIANCPTIIDLLVASDLRGRGIGARLLTEAECCTAARGYSRIGLAVGVTNLRARALYERQGYQDAGVGAFSVSWTEIGEGGSEEPASETCVYLTKSLSVVHQRSDHQRGAGYPIAVDGRGEG